MDSIDAYLLTWNPRTWTWDDLEQEVEQTARGRPVVHSWSTGGAKRIKPGDRLFLLRQGPEPRGIMGAGWATSEPYENGHWDAERREQGDTSLGVDVRFDRIFNPEVDEIVPLARLRTGPLAAVHWATQRSGIRIKQGLDELERLWAELIGLYNVTQSDAGALGAVEGEQQVVLNRHRARERWLRDEKIAQVKAENNGRLPCEVCGFDFLRTYGELGRDYAQVHHLKPLADRAKPSQTLLADLAVLCANCHVMVHRYGGNLPLDSLLSRSE
jgi:5-methylcytosine-specific restriction protein A